MKTVDFGFCDECGGKIVPILNTWINGKYKITGIDVLRCEECGKDFVAPPDFDICERIK